MALFDKKDDIFKLMEKFEKSSIIELELEAGEGIRVRLSKVNPAQPPVYLPDFGSSSAHAVHTITHHVGNDEPAEKAGDDNFKTINAPIIGTFYSSASPEAEPYVKVGDKINKGAIICILEAMKIMNEIECEQDCEIVEILVNNGDQIEYNQPLFKIK